MNSLVSIIYLIFISHGANAEGSLPEITYIERLSEKSVNWPMEVEVDYDQRGPFLKVWIGLPKLLRVKPVANNYKIIKTQSKDVAQVVYFETTEKLSGLKFEKLEGEESAKQVTLKVNFKNQGYVGSSSECKKLFNLNSYQAEGAIKPLVAYLKCDDLKSVTIYATPEVRPRKQTFKNPIEPVAKKNADLKVRFSKEEYNGEAIFVLSSVGDVLDRFETSPRQLRDISSNAIPENKSKLVTSLGGNVSRFDPELFLNFRGRPSTWEKKYLQFTSQVSLPLLLSGESKNNPIDVIYALTINHSFKDPLEEKTFVTIGLGLESMTRTEQNLIDQNPYLAFGPKIQMSLFRLYSFSQTSNLSLNISTSRLSKSIGKAQYDGIYTAEFLLSLVTANGKYLEPRVTLQALDFGHERSEEIYLIKLGLGVKF
jgi:hypothetical protein